MNLRKSIAVPPAIAHATLAASLVPAERARPALPADGSVSGWLSVVTGVAAKAMKADAFQFPSHCRIRGGRSSSESAARLPGAGRLQSALLAAGGALDVNDPEAGGLCHRELAIVG